MTTIQPNFQSALDNYVKGVRDAIEYYWKAAGSPFTLPQIRISKGKRYIRIYRDYGELKAIHSFVEKKTGNVLGFKTWKLPSRLATSIYAPDCTDHVDYYTAYFYKDVPTGNMRNIQIQNENN